MTSTLFGPSGETLTPFRLRIVCAVLLPAFCLITYGACNSYAASLGVTRCLAASWEFQIPRLTWLVVPYLTIDIMVALSPLFAIRFDELRALLLRMFWAFAVACVVFVVFPCRCDYPRTIPGDWSAPLFQLLHLTDLPFNQAPSLHVSEAIIIAPVLLARIRRPAWRAALIFWFTLGALATVLVYQHHVIDVFTGAALGFAVVKFIRRR